MTDISSRVGDANKKSCVGKIHLMIAILSVKSSLNDEKNIFLFYVNNFTGPFYSICHTFKHQTVI